MHVNDKTDFKDMQKKHTIYIWILIAVMASAAISCAPDWKDEMIPDASVTDIQTDTPGDRDINTDTRKVMLLYSAGFNSISRYLSEDIEDLSQGWIPRKRRADDVILVYSHLPSAAGRYSEQTCPVLFRLYSESDGTIVRDTLVRYEEGSNSASAKHFNDVISYVHDNFPAKSYGLVLSSHATGYLPSGFYSKPDNYTFQEDIAYSWGIRKWREPVPVPYVEPVQEPGVPAVKSICQYYDGTYSYEMDIRDFAEAIPMKLDYILFDACLMGGIEVAYELAGKCDKVGFSQAEVLAEGFNYTTLTSHLLGNKSDSDPYSVCQDYYEQYDIKSGIERSATISFIDCNRLENLASVCKELFESYSAELERITASNVQRFYRSSHHWFYDLVSILENAGISKDEMEALQEALDDCVIYKNATPSFLGEFTIDTFSGFSMYLPCNGDEELDKYYKTLKWNKATGLVK